MTLSKWVTSAIRYLTRQPPFTADLTGATFNTYTYFNVNLEEGAEQESSEPARKKRKTVQERNDSKHCCNVTTCLSNRPVTGKHCAPMLIWMNARGLTSNVIPMNVPIFIGKNATTAAISKANNSPRQLLSVNLPTHPHMNPAISAKILSKTLSLFGFFYTQNYVFQSLPLCSMY